MLVHRLSATALAVAVVAPALGAQQRPALRLVTPAVQSAPISNIRYGVTFGQPVHAGADREGGLRFLGGAGQLVDVALAVADVDTPGRLAEQLGRLPQVSLA